MSYNSQIGNNEYTTVEQRRKQQLSRMPVVQEPVNTGAGSAGNGTAVTTAAASSPFDEYKSLLQQIQAERKAAADAAYKQGKANLDNARGTALRDGYVAYMQGLKNMPQISAVSGNGGYAQSLLNKQQLNYENNRSAVEQEFLSTEKSTGYSTKNGKPAPIVMFQKKLNGNYVVVEAVSDAKKNKNFVVSMYISKDGVPQNKIAKVEQQPSMANDNVVGRDTAKPLTADTFTNNNIPQTAETDNGNVLQKTADRKALEDEVKRIVGIDTRTEAEKVAQEQQSKVAMAQEWADKGIAPQEDVERLKASAVEKVSEAKAKESLENAVKLIEYAGKEADVYSDNRDRAAAYNTAKRIGINLAHNDTTAMGRAVHEVGHDKTATKEWESYTEALDRLIATDGRLVKLMEDIDYAYRNSEDAEVRASVSFEDGSFNEGKIREEQYLKLTEIMLPNIAKGDKQLLDAIKKDRNVLDNLLDFIRGIKNKVSIKLTKSEAAMLDEAERQLVNLLRSESSSNKTNQKLTTVQYSQNIDNWGENSYNRSKWIKENNLVSNREYEDFVSKVMSIKTGAHFEKASNGLYMIPTGKEFGVNNTLIFTDGNSNNPSVEKVVHINLDNETAIEKVRDYIYAKEIGKWKYASRVAGNIFSKELFTEHRIEDFRNIYQSSGKSKGSSRAEDSGYNQQQRNGKRNYTEGTGALKGYRGENLKNYDTKYDIPQVTLADGENYFITKTGEKWDSLTGNSDEYDTLKEAVEAANKEISAEL